MPTTFWISSTFLTKDGASRAQFAFSTDEAASVEGFVRVVQQRGMIFGERLTLKLDSGSHVIEHRRPYGLAAGGIAAVQLFSGRVIEVTSPRRMPEREDC